MKKSNSFCLDVSSLDDKQKRAFAKKLKADVDSYNKSLGEGESQEDE